MQTKVTEVLLVNMLISVYKLSGCSSVQCSCNILFKSIYENLPETGDIGFLA